VEKLANEITSVLCLLFVIIISVSSLSIPIAQSSSSSDAGSILAETAETLRAYSSHETTVTAESTSAKGNSVNVQVEACVLNPLHNSDPTSDFYIFNIFVFASSAQQNDWYLTSDGFDDKCGPTLQVDAICDSSEVIYQRTISPSNLESYTNGNTPETRTLSLSFGSFSIGTSRTFTPPASQARPDKITDQEVDWTAAATTGGNPNLSSYAYAFALGVQVPKGQSARITVTAVANFYQAYQLLSAPSDSASLYRQVAFSAPPITTITSNPAGASFVQVDGVAITTPMQYCWNEGNTHTITAATSVPDGVGQRYSFISWNNGGAQSHTIQAPTQPTTLTANYEIEYALTVASSPDGRTDPSADTYWYASSQVVTVTAIPDSGYTLRNWVLDGVDVGNSQTIQITMDGPHNLGEVFVASPTPVDFASQPLVSSDLNNVYLILGIIVILVAIILVVVVVLHKKKVKSD
jgi:hypothetical protein